MDSFLTNFLANGEQYIQIGLAVIGVASLVANLTPTQTDNKIVNAVGKVVNFLAAYWRDPDAATKSTTTEVK